LFKSIAAKEKKVKKIKKVKDPNAPKRGLTAFLFFVQRKQKEFKDNNPNLAHKEVISKMGEDWNNMGEKDKKPFQDLALADKARYEKEKAEYESKGGDKKGVTKKKTDPSPGKVSEKKTKKVPSFCFLIMFLLKFVFVKDE